MSEINPPANNTPAEIRGSCLCGQVLVTVTGAPVASAVCHCLHCQKTAGSAFSTVLLLPDEAVSVEGGVRSYHDVADSGASVTRSFCGRCGSPVETSSAGTEAQKLRLIKAGLFAGVREFPPQLEIFCASRRSWVPAFTGTTAFVTMPPR